MGVALVPSRIRETPVNPEQVGGTFVFSANQADMQKRHGHPERSFNGPEGFVPYTEILPKGVTLEAYQKRWADGEIRGPVTDSSRTMVEPHRGAAPKVAP